MPLQSHSMFDCWRKREVGHYEHDRPSYIRSIQALDGQARSQESRKAQARCAAGRYRAIDVGDEDADLSP